VCLFKSNLKSKMVYGFFLLIGSTQKIKRPKDVERSFLIYFSETTALGQLELNLVGIFIGWFSKKFFFNSSDPKGLVRYCHHLVSIIAVHVVCKNLHFNLIWNQLEPILVGMIIGWSEVYKRKKRPTRYRKYLIIFSETT
jgi:hypothetical protein